MSPSALSTSALFFTLFILLLYVISLMLTTLTFTVSLKLGKTNHYLYWTSKLYPSKLLLTKRLKPWFHVKIRLFQRTWTHVHVRYMLSPIRLTVCRLSVTLVHPTQPVDISAFFLRRLAPWLSYDISEIWNILRISSQGKPSVRAFKRKTGSQI